VCPKKKYAHIISTIRIIYFPMFFSVTFIRYLVTTSHYQMSSTVIVYCTHRGLRRHQFSHLNKDMYLFLSSETSLDVSAVLSHAMHGRGFVKTRLQIKGVAKNPTQLSVSWVSGPNNTCVIFPLIVPDTNLCACPHLPHGSDYHDTSGVFEIA
jgi:hypothetical protein